MSTADHHAVGIHPRVNIGSARWVKFRSAPTLLDLGELDVERPQPCGVLRPEVGAQQVAPFAPSYLAQLGPLELELQAGCRRAVLRDLDLDQVRGAPGLVFGRTELASAIGPA